MPAAVELQKAEKKAAEAFNKAAAMGAALKTNTGTPPSRHNITASLEVDEEVAAALKFALQHIGDVKASPADEYEAGKSGEEEKPEEASYDEGQENNGLNALILDRVRSLEAEQRKALATLVSTRGLNALLREDCYEQELSTRSWKGGFRVCSGEARLQAGS